MPALITARKEPPLLPGVADQIVACGGSGLLKFGRRRLSTAILSGRDVHMLSSAIPRLSCGAGRSIPVVCGKKVLREYEHDSAIGAAIRPHSFRFEPDHLQPGPPARLAILRDVSSLNLAGPSGPVPFKKRGP